MADAPERTIQEQLRDQRWNNLGYYTQTANAAADALAERDKVIEGLVGALERIACQHVTDSPLWWQQEARAALAAARELRGK